MSLIIERININGRELIKTYSDANMMIRQNGTGALYSEAIDPENMERTYIETDIQIEHDIENNEDLNILPED